MHNPGRKAEFLCPHPRIVEKRVDKVQYRIGMQSSERQKLHEWHEHFVASILNDDTNKVELRLKCWSNIVRN
jgi:hypothetical protein